MERSRTLELALAVCALIATLCPEAPAQYAGGTNCYANALVGGSSDVGGLIGSAGSFSELFASFWDIEASGQLTSAGGGTGFTTVEMQTAATFLEAGWDSVGESANGTEEIWWIDEGRDYPRLRWEVRDEASP